MRILYSFPHPIGSPGIGATAFETVSALARAGHQLTVITTSEARPLPPDVDVHTTLAIGGARIPHRAVGLARAYALHDRRTARSVERLAGHIDVVHAWPRACLRTFAAARRAGVSSFRESPSPHTAEALAAARRANSAAGVTLPRDHFHADVEGRLLTEIAEYEAADIVLVPSAYAATTFLDRGFSADRLRQHAYGVDVGRFKPRVRHPAGGVTVVFLGRVEPAKGVRTLLQAWRYFEPASGDRLLLVGAALPGFRTALGPLAEQAGVEWVGFATDIPTLLDRCDVLALPSYSEGCAIVVLEAMAAGCVPLVSAATGAPVDDGHTGLIHAVGDAEALATSLRALRADPARLAAMSAACIARRPSITWDVAIQRLVRAYRRMT